MQWEWQTEVVPLSPVAYWALVAAAVVGVVVFLVLNAVILRKAGHSGWWSLVALFPLLYVVGVWIFAWSQWPRTALTAVPPDPRVLS